jgi:hypothetical protein
MNVYKELETMGFFDYLYKVHKLQDSAMNPEYLDEYPMSHIHKTVVNCLVFRWFREKYDIDISINTIYSKYNENTSKKYRVVIDNKTVFTNVGFYDTYEEAQKECILDLISIIKNQKK